MHQTLNGEFKYVIYLYFYAYQKKEEAWKNVK